MTLSELIQKLSDEMKKSGDVEVSIRDAEGFESPATGVENRGIGNYKYTLITTD